MDSVRIKIFDKDQLYIDLALHNKEIKVLQRGTSTFLDTILQINITYERLYDFLNSRINPKKPYLSDILLDIEKTNGLKVYEDNISVKVEFLTIKNNDFVEISKNLSKLAHQEQYDKAGQEYYKHPIAVANIIEFEMESELSKLDYSNRTKQEVLDILIATAFLHDIIEDTMFTADDLINNEIPYEVVELVHLLTRKRDITYFEYIELISKNKLATIVKIADIKHNLDLRRFNDNKVEINDSLIKRYTKASNILYNSLNKH